MLQLYKKTWFSIRLWRVSSVLLTRLNQFICRTELTYKKLLWNDPFQHLVPHLVQLVQASSSTYRRLITVFLSSYSASTRNSFWWSFMSRSESSCSQKRYLRILNVVSARSWLFQFGYHSLLSVIPPPATRGGVAYFLQRWASLCLLYQLSRSSGWTPVVFTEENRHSAQRWRGSSG